jgi:hypothetical protein
LTARAAIRSPFHASPGVTRRDAAARKGRAAATLPLRLVVGLSAAIFAVAAFSLVWTVAIDPETTFAQADAPAITGGIALN